MNYPVNMNRKMLVGSVTLALLVIIKITAQTADFTVSTDGDDKADGTAGAPFATLDRARIAVRDLHLRDPRRDRPIVVRVRGGIYHLESTLTFTPEDSGTHSAPVVYEAATDEEPILSAGTPVSGWTLTQQGRWQARLPEAAHGNRIFSQLYVNGQRRFRPTWPRQGYNFVAAASPIEPNVCPDRFVYRTGDILPEWQRLSEKEVCVIHNWNLSRFPILAVDPSSRTVTLAGRTWHASLNDITPRNWYRVENVLEAFDQPGQWYLDRESGILSYIPLPGEDHTTANVIAPLHDTVIELKGDVSAATTVEHLVFRGLTLAHNNWSVPSNGYSYAQAEAPITGALTARNARHIRVERCIVRHTGTYGIDFGNGCRDCTVESCELFDLGAGGVKVGIAWEGEHDPRNYAYGCIVRDNLIAYGGRIHPAGVGVWIGHAASNRVERNTIHDLYYSGISAGWKWSFGPNPAHANIIEWNRIFRIGQGVLSDLGGIYMLGEQPGSVERFNVMHGIRRSRYGGWGVYFDSGSSHILVENNLVYDTEDGGLIHGNNSKSNLVRNNIFALGQKTQLTINTAPNGEPLRFERNIVLWQESDLFLHAPPESVTAYSNLYWRVGSSVEELSAPHTSTGKQLAREKGSIAADPLFADLSRHDFTLTANSPAHSIGVVTLDLSAAGRTTQTARTAALPRPPEAYQPAPPEPELPLAEDFETLALGQGLPGWHLASAGRN
ncbi:MAG: right-handed parallel beta-helix repeat-containing protein, partial [Kiritimatiellae bacterium]|nr:right-handed parallel beta-helix repeat-containing protein [Kiritimatiellia bacterium]